MTAVARRLACTLGFALIPFAVARAAAIVIVRGDRIVEVGEAGRIALPPCRDEIDAGGGTVLPGLVDAHVHLQRLLESGSEALTAWLRAGVTSLIDLGSVASPAEVKARAAGAAGPSPAVFAAGPILTAPGGYPFRSDGGPALEVRGAGEAAAAVDRLAAGGADLIKVAIERGFLADYADSGWPVLAPEELRAITGAAHRQGLRVVAHLTQAGEFTVALAAGVDGVAHTPITPLSAELIAEAVRRDVVFTTTISLWTSASDRQAVCSNLRHLLDSGGTVALGTDAPAFQAPGLPLGEIEALRACPLTAMDILVAATRGAAHALGRDGELGVIRPGARADLLVVDGDPLADLAALGRIRAVVHGGVRVALPVRAPTAAQQN